MDKLTTDFIKISENSTNKEAAIVVAYLEIVLKIYYEFNENLLTLQKYLKILKESSISKSAQSSINELIDIILEYPYKTDTLHNDLDNLKQWVNQKKIDEPLGFSPVEEYFEEYKKSLEYKSHILIQSFVASFNDLTDFIAQKKYIIAREKICSYLEDLLKLFPEKPTNEAGKQGVSVMFEFDKFFREKNEEFLQREFPSDTRPHLFVGDFLSFIFCIDDYLTPGVSYYIEHKDLLHILTKFSKTGRSVLFETKNLATEHDPQR